MNKAAYISELSSQLDNIKIKDTETPQPGPGQVLVKMKYAPINPSDFNFIRGDYLTALQRLSWNKNNQPPHFHPDAPTPHPLPGYILGGEGCGVVEASGGGLLANRLVGKRVAVSAGPPMGTWQQYTIIDAKKAVPVPAQLSDEQASMYLVNPLSCYAMLLDILKIKAGGWLVITGAGSAMAKMVIRIAKLHGVRTIGLVRSAKRIDELNHVGVDAVVVTEQQDIQQSIFDITKGRGADYAMDCIGGETLAQVISSMTVNGHIVVYGTLASSTAEVHIRDLMMPCVKISGFFAGNWMASLSLWQKVKVLKKLKKLALQGVFDTPVSEILPLQQAQQAVTKASGAQLPGKILLSLNDT